MSENFDLLIVNGICATPSGIAPANVGVRDGRIVAIGSLSGARAAETFNAKGLHVLPGVMDTQAHFREPGNEHKEDLESGSRAAVLGGVTRPLRRWPQLRTGGPGSSRPRPPLSSGP